MTILPTDHGTNHFYPWATISNHHQHEPSINTISMNHNTINHVPTSNHHLMHEFHHEINLSLQGGSVETEHIWGMCSSPLCPCQSACPWWWLALPLAPAQSRPQQHVIWVGWCPHLLDNGWFRSLWTAVCLDTRWCAGSLMMIHDCWFVVKARLVHGWSLLTSDLFTMNNW